MKLTFIECNNCDSQKGIVMSDTHANCVSCNRPASLTGTPVFYPIEEIVHIEDMTTQEQETSPSLIDWSTCFETDEIRVAI
tara:strand:- start:910 stop:1152 length:243 start_codon:yes stop_codon:yes gene_type:complete